MGNNLQIIPSISTKKFDEKWDKYANKKSGELDKKKLMRFIISLGKVMGFTENMIKSNSKFLEESFSRNYTKLEFQKLFFIFLHNKGVKKYNFDSPQLDRLYHNEMLKLKLGFETIMTKDRIIQIWESYSELIDGTRKINKEKLR